MVGIGDGGNCRTPTSSVPQFLVFARSRFCRTARQHTKCLGSQCLPHTTMAQIGERLQSHTPSYAGPNMDDDSLSIAKSVKVGDLDLAARYVPHLTRPSGHHADSPCVACPCGCIHDGRRCCSCPCACVGRRDLAWVEEAMAPRTSSCRRHRRRVACGLGSAR